SGTRQNGVEPVHWGRYRRTGPATLPRPVGWQQPLASHPPTRLVCQVSFNPILHPLARSRKFAKVQLIALGLALLQAAPHAIPTSTSQPAPTADTEQFVGFHGTSSVYVPLILAGINPPDDNAYGNQLGVGFYTTPDQRVAQKFAETTVVLRKLEGLE